MRSIVTRRVLLAAGLSLGPGSAFGQASPDKRFSFYFRPEPRSTIAYQVTERELLSGGRGKHSERRWHYSLTVVLGQPSGDMWPATVTVSDVSVLNDKDSYPYLYLTLVQIAEGLPIAVRLDRFGFVDEVVDWPTVRTKLKRALADRVPREDALLVPEILDRADAAQGSGMIGRMLTLIGGGYTVTFRMDGSSLAVPNWVGGSAYVWPSGRTMTTEYRGQDAAKGLMAVQWSIATDPAVAARHLGPELRSFLSGRSGQDVATARDEIDKALASGGVTLKENGEVLYSRSRRIISTYASMLEIELGRFRKEREVLAELISP